MKSKIIKAIILMIIIGASAFGVFNLFKSDVLGTKTMTLSSTETEAPASANIGTIVPGQKNPNSYGYNSSCGSFWEARHKNSMPLPLPTKPGYQIYCTEHGIDSEFSTSAPGYKEILASNGKSTTGDACPPLSPEEGTLSTIGYTASGSGQLPPVAAYIISGDPEGVWTADKQRGLWNLSKYTGGLVIVAGHSPNDGPSKYDKEALDYLKYDKEVRGKGLQPKDETLKPEDIGGTPTEEQQKKVVRVLVNQKTGEYTAGPFKLNYTNGIYGKVAFSGISNMEVMGYNDKGEVVRGKKDDGIKIEKIILVDSVTGQKGKAQVPDYFTPDKEKIDRTEQVYPKPEQEFYVVYKDPNAGLKPDDEKRVAGIAIKVKFNYMLADGKYTEYTGEMLQVMHRHFHVQTLTGTKCTRTIYLNRINKQDQMCADAIRTLYEQEIIIGLGDDEKPIPVDTTMELGGHVWEDGVATKESKADGVSNTTGDNVDKSLPNVKVTLYEVVDGKGQVATLMSKPTEEGIDEAELLHRVNPTYTDNEGNYLFRGLDPMKKYYVRFDYNGQIYLPTEYLNTANKQYGSVQEIVNAGLYNTETWNITSKGTEAPNDRIEYDKKFEEIGSYPENYASSNSLGKVGAKNAAYTQRDLMGYKLDREGKYQYNQGDQLIDGYKYDADGNQTDEYAQGIITTKIKEYINANKKSPDEDAMKQIYSDIAGSDTETWRKLQFVEDCYIKAYSGSPLNGGKIDYYPVYDQFKINKAINGTYDMSSDIIDGVEYKPIYPGQYYVNLGLWRRQEYDSALRKDAYRAVMKINNKTVMYKYDKRTDDEEYWDINVRMSDYDAYYNTGYNREVYKTDYEYSSRDLNHPGADLEIYVTYKITVRNQSQSIMTQVKEVVDYYDKEYTYRDDLSWVTYIDGNKNNTVKDQEYYDAMVAEDVSKIANARETKASTSGSKYGASTHSDVTNTYGAVYVKGLEDKKLATGESAYIYLTFQVNKQNGKVILDDESNPKQNIAEINGYSTFYKDGTQLPNGVTKNSSDIAGLLDRDSNPGNLVQEDIADKDRYEKNFEDDTDRAKSLRVLIDENAIRKANGTVWEDERTTKSENSTIGDGVRDEKETKVAGVTVQLTEKTIDGKEYIWQETTTNADGYYAFESYIPGDYVIRFYYGNTTGTAKIKGNKDYSAGGQNDVSYNGQDFKSTTYQSGMKQSDYTDEAKRYTGYKNTTTQNETGTYGYDIYAADSNKSNVSDAKDLWSVSNKIARTYKPNATINEKREIQGRQRAIDYSKDNVTNNKAEVLASPYETPSYNGTKYTSAEMDSLIKELIDNTYMTAETGVIAVEFEYDRQQSEGLKDTENNSGNSSNDYVTESNRYNGGYELKNIDLGLTERPKSQLEIDKSIANVKVTLANGSVLFDVNKAGDNVIWKDHAEYNLGSKKDSKGKYEEYYGKNGKNRYSYRDEVNTLVGKSDKGLIQLTMDEELMHGATIEITYKLKVTNVGEVDYEGQKFYYLGDSSGANIVTTVSNQVVDYVANNLQFNSNNKDNNGWSIIQKEKLKTDGLVNDKLTDNVAKFNNIIQTEGLNKVLKPGENTGEKTLILTQLITTENKSDDLTYKNITEIVKTSNTVGRRMAYSVVGNQDPTAENASEVDASVAEKVIILPPFGETHIFYILGAIIGIILVGGIAFIIRKVLKK